MGRVSVKGVLIGGILDIFATFVLAIPLMAIVMVQLHLTESRTSGSRTLMGRIPAN